MKCPKCGFSIRAKSIAAHLGSKGGATTGVTKRRDVDYAALAAKRWAKDKA